MGFIEMILMFGFGMSAVGMLGLAILAGRSVAEKTIAAIPGQPADAVPGPASVFRIDQAADRPAAARKDDRSEEPHRLPEAA